ncbi:hypothetical protein [Halorubrum saccharovorum]|uniref:hypothetical protein n=1 Tax=Halorubrum saccharovorum TaxID=2248 RepID=UPI001F3E480A|nr:hypothetical protein [Halorubrum saccharovorum]
MSDDNNHANAANEQLRQSRDNGTIPDSREDYSSIRLVVDGEKLTADNPIDYLVMLLLEGKRYDGHYDGDETEVARWAIAQWCQETGWAPDLTDYDAGEQVELGDEVPYLNAAFYGAVDEGDLSRGVVEATLDIVEETIVDEDMTGASREQVARGTVQRIRRKLNESDDVQEDDDTEGLGELVDGHERGVVAIIREGIEQHRGNVYDANVPMTKDELDAAADLATAVEGTAEGDDA